jgi:hypothetical protein
LPSLRAKKSFSTFSWPICRDRTSTFASLAVPSTAALEDPRCTAQQLLLPVVDLVRVDPELTRQLGDRPVPPDRRRRYPPFERRVVLLPCPLISCSRAIRAFYGQGPTLANRLIFRVQLIPTGTAADKGFDIDEVNRRLLEPAVELAAIGADIENR